MTDKEYMENIDKVGTDELFENLEYYGFDSYYKDLWYATIGELKKRVVHTAEPRGKWVKVIDYSDEYEKRWHYECSECKNAPYYCGEIYKLHFCPNCGADMRGGEEE